MTEPPIEKRHWNALYLLLATSTIFMTLVVGMQPWVLSEVIGVSGPGVGAINAGVQVAAEALGLFLIGYLGYMSDRISRTPIIFAGLPCRRRRGAFSPLQPRAGPCVRHRRPWILFPLPHGYVFGHRRRLAPVDRPGRGL